MGRFFDMESPVMQGLGRIVDLVILNLITVVCSLPIFTLGAAVSALYEALERLHREEGGLIRGYFRAFRGNFRKATCIWLILLAAMAIILISLRFYWNSSFRILSVIAVFALVVWVMIFTWAFPLTAKFENTVRNTLKNALLCSVGYLPRTMVMAALNLVPVLLLMYPEIFARVSIFLILIWFSLVAEVALRLLKKAYQVMGTGSNPKE